MSIIKRCLRGLYIQINATLLESIDKNVYSGEIAENVLEKMIQHNEKSYTRKYQRFYNTKC